VSATSAGLDEHPPDGQGDHLVGPIPSISTRVPSGRTQKGNLLAADIPDLGADEVGRRPDTGAPKQRDGRVESLRNLPVTRRNAVNQRADAQYQSKALIITAPDDLHARPHSLAVKELIATCTNQRPDGTNAATPATATATATATKIALRCLARRHQQLTTEIADLDELLEPLVAAINPGLLAANGVGTDIAGQLLVTAGENHDRLTSEAAFAMLCAAAPTPASSGKTTRHRLNRSGDRHANKALYRMVLCRLRRDPRTHAHAETRTKDNPSRKEIIQRLKRHAAREIYQVIALNNLELVP
jgi:transposase